MANKIKFTQSFAPSALLVIASINDTEIETFYIRFDITRGEFYVRSDNGIDSRYDLLGAQYFAEIEKAIKYCKQNVDAREYDLKKFAKEFKKP